MKMKVYRKDDQDIAIGSDKNGIIVRKGRAKAKLKKATVIPIATIDDLREKVDDITKGFVKDGFNYLQSVDVSEDNPYPMVKGEVTINWALSIDSSVNVDELLTTLMNEAQHAANVLHDSELCKSTFTCNSDDEPTEIVIECNKAIWSIGTTDAVLNTLPAHGHGGGDLKTDDPTAAFLLILYLAKLHPGVVSLATSLGVEIEPDLISSEALLPFDITNDIKDIGEMLNLCIAPINWSAMVEDNPNNQAWFF